ncbi:MAG TPA: hypothetical protein ENH10_03830, partial [Bacteroidetes bacterium]|nr:hypothetical protein [Bacteroidota bacterium]HEX04272.1 hypothetical protein [Bacteroidota bacterium]
MHRHGIALGTTFLLLIMVSLGFASAPLDSQSAQVWQNVESTMTGVRAQVSVPMVEFVTDDQGSYISIPGFLPNGSPLPSTTTMIVVPNGLGVVAQINATEYVGTGLYAEELAGTLESVEVGDPVVFKGIRLFPITVLPARVAADGEIMIANDLHLEVEFAGEDDRAEGSVEPFAVSSEMARTIRGMVMNIDEINVNEVAPVGRLLVVIENNATFMTRIEPYVQWKRQQGYVVEIGH